jgi:methanogenic corrinoid protein MtbC1
MTTTSREGLRDRFVSAFVTAQLGGDRAAAMAVVDDALVAGLSALRVQIEIIQPAQYEIGRLWATNAIGVAQEHLATAIAQLALARLYPHLVRAPRNGKTVVVACVEGELHEMGARVSADFLEAAGFDVRYLGANVPTDHLAQMIASTRPDLVALSVAIVHNLPGLRAAVARLRQDHGAALPILVGGQALRWSRDAIRGLGVDGLGEGAEELVDLARRLLLPGATP